MPTAADKYPFSLSIVTITLNEEGAIEKVIGNLRSVVGDAEIVIVDSSTDKTPLIAESLGCKVIRQLPPKGYGLAYHAGFSAAQGDVIVTLDCDDTYPVESIDTLLEKIEAGFDIVSASRLKGRPKAMPVPNYLANYLFAKLAYLLCGVKTTDVHTGMRAYRKHVLQEFPYDPNGPALPVELYVGPATQNYKCTEILIDYRPRIGKSKLQPLSSTVWTIKRLWKWRRFGRRFN